MNNWFESMSLEKYSGFPKSEKARCRLEMIIQHSQKNRKKFYEKKYLTGFKLTQDMGDKVRKIWNM